MAGGWERCAACLGATVSAFYILPALRAGATEPPALVGEPLPLDRLWVGFGDFKAFRERAWASLLAHEPTQRVNYDVLDAYRVLEINFQRDDPEHGYGSISEVASLQLLILTITGGPGNPYTGPVLSKLLEWRTMAGRPTWVYVGLDTRGLRSFLGSEVPSLLTALQTPARLQDTADGRAIVAEVLDPKPVRSRIARPRPAS